jgi:hypothetical protein
MNALRSMAAALGGDVAGASILCPAPGHSPRDRSLSVTLSSTHPDGFVVYSHANDPWQDCRDHFRSRLGTDRTHARVPRASSAPQQVSAVEVLKLRAEVRAFLWWHSQMELPEAVDGLQSFAESSGLVDQLGQTAVQAIIAAPFAWLRAIEEAE